MTTSLYPYIDMKIGIMVMCNRLSAQIRATMDTGRKQGLRVIWIDGFIFDLESEVRCKGRGNWIETTLCKGMNSLDHYIVCDRYSKCSFCHPYISKCVCDDYLISAYMSNWKLWFWTKRTTIVVVYVFEYWYIL